MRLSSELVPSGFCSTVFALLMLAVPAPLAQAVVVPWIGPDDGNWNEPANWQDGTIFGLPNAANNEAAAINNDTTAVLSTPASTDIAGVFLGQTGGASGGLRITNGGSLNSIPGASESGALTIGGGGQGNLTILGGGSLMGQSLSLGGSAASNILLGDSSGLTASISTVGNASLNRTTRIIGPSVNFSAGGNLTLGSTGTLIGQITSPTLHSPLKSAGTANVGGTFKVEFDGVTPSGGNTWNIIDAAEINGTFATLDTSAAPALPSGQGYALKRTTGGTHGELLQLTIEQLLTLQVNRDTGTVSIRNAAAGGTNPVTFDGYTIHSPLGALTGTWNSLTDQSTSGWQETPPGGSATDLSELHPTAGGLTLTGGQSRQLGTPYDQAFPEFGVEPDQLEFEYSTGGQVRNGVIEFLGTKVHNNLTVTINPATGQAQLKNDSPFSVSIDAYEIESPSGSLRPTNGQWLSLDDQNVSGWEEANPTTNFLSETNPNGSLTLAPGQTFNLGAPFTAAGGTQDLEFRFFLLTELDGDYNGDGVVDAADYVVWRKSDGSAAGYNEWRSNFGEIGGGAPELRDGVVVYGPIAGGGAIAAVPEPSALALLMLFALLVPGFSVRITRSGATLALT